MAEPTLDSYIDHFNTSCRGDLNAAGNALCDGDKDAFDRVVERVKSYRVTQYITDAINSSSKYFNEFTAKIREFCNSDEFKFVSGGIMTAVGGSMLAEAAALAAAIGITVLSVKVIAIGLILWGLYIVLPMLWGKAAKMFEDALNQAN